MTHVTACFLGCERKEGGAAMAGASIWVCGTPSAVTFHSTACLMHTVPAAGVGPGVQELARFNALLSVMRSSLASLGQACKGLALMSTQLDQLGRALFDGKVRQPAGSSSCAQLSAGFWVWVQALKPKP